MNHLKNLKQNFNLQAIICLVEWKREKFKLTKNKLQVQSITWMGIKDIRLSEKEQNSGLQIDIDYRLYRFTI